MQTHSLRHQRLRLRPPSNQIGQDKNSSDDSKFKIEFAAFVVRLFSLRTAKERAG